MAMSGIIVVFVTVVVFPTCMELLKQWLLGKIKVLSSRFHGLIVLL